MRHLSSHVAWGEARRLLRRCRGRLTVALAFVTVNRLAALALPISSKYVVDDVIIGQRSRILGPMALLVCAAIAIEAVSAFGAAQVAGVAAQRAIAELRQELQARVAGLPLRQIDTSPSGALVARVMTDPEQIRYLVGNGLVQLVASLLTAALALGLLFWLDPSLTLAVLAIVGLVGLGVDSAFRQITESLQGVMRQQAELTGWLGQVLGGVRVVKAYAAERHVAYRFARESHRLVRENLQALRGVSLLNAGSSLAASALGVLLLVAGGRAVGADDMSLGSYVMYIWLAGCLLGPVFHIAASAGELGKAVAALGRIREIRKLATEEEEDRSRHRIPRVVGTINFDEVSYGYAPDRLALRAISLHAPAGSTTALVGPNGSGKSTLCRLLIAHDRPAAGRILVDGHDLASLHRRVYRSYLGVVLQDDVLFDGTITDSICYGRPGASLTEVQAAARLAYCDEFVARLAEGYSTRIGERGLHLSAGQRQRVAIARAFLVDPRILVLDEATSSLDAESEGMIQDALRILCRGRTTFVIAHRLSTVRDADQIIVLDQGSITERGTHQELVGQRGSYFRRYAAQRPDSPDCPAASADYKTVGLPLGHPEHVGHHCGGSNHGR